MFTFLKAQASSLIATGVDFLVTVLLVEVFHVWYVASNVFGSTAGGVVNFLLGRDWVFNAENGKAPQQVVRYLLVWTGSIGLNTLGVYIFTHYTGISYVYSKVITSIIVAFSYNYFLQKRYVFR